MASITSRQASSTASATRRSASLVAPVPLPQRMCFQAASPEQRAPASRASVMARVASAVGADAGVSMGPAETGLPRGYHWYETMIILKPNLSDEERDRELAKFEAYLNKEECLSINALVKGRTKLAYPIKKEQEGIYVLYTYCAKRQTARAIQMLLSNPEAGAEDTILRHITLCKI